MKILISINFLAIVILSLGSNDLNSGVYTPLTVPTSTCCIPITFTITTAITAPTTSTTLSLSSVTWAASNGCSILGYSTSETLSLSSSDAGATYIFASLTGLTVTYASGTLSWAYVTGCIGPYVFTPPNYLAAGIYSASTTPGTSCCLPLGFTIAAGAFVPIAASYTVNLSSPTWSVLPTLTNACSAKSYIPSSSTPISISTTDSGSTYSGNGLNGLNVLYSNGGLSMVYPSECTTAILYQINELLLGNYAAIIAPGSTCCLPLTFSLSSYNAPTTSFTLSLISVTWATVNGCSSISYTTSNSLALSTTNTGSSYTVTGLTGMTATYSNGQLSMVYGTGCTTAVIYQVNPLIAGIYYALATPATTCCFPLSFAIVSAPVYSSSALTFDVVITNVIWPTTNGCNTSPLTYTISSSMTLVTSDGGNTYTAAGLTGMTATYSTGSLAMVYASVCTTAVSYQINPLLAGIYTAMAIPASTCCLPFTFTIVTPSRSGYNFNVVLTSVTWPTTNRCWSISYTTASTVVLETKTGGSTYTATELTGMIATYSAGDLSMVYATGCTTAISYQVNALLAGPYGALAVPASTCCLPLSFSISSSAYTSGLFSFNVTLINVVWPTINGCTTSPLTYTTANTAILITGDEGNTYTVTGLIGMTVTYSTGSLSMVYASGCTTAVSYQMNPLLAGTYTAAASPASPCCLPSSFAIATYAATGYTFNVALTSATWPSINDCSTISYTTAGTIALTTTNGGNTYSGTGLTGMIATYSNGTISMVYVTGCITTVNYQINLLLATNYGALVAPASTCCLPLGFVIGSTAFNSGAFIFNVVLTNVIWPLTNGCSTLSYTTGTSITLSTTTGGSTYTTTGLIGMTVTYTTGTLSLVYATGCTTAVVYAPNPLLTATFIPASTPASTCCLPQSFAISSLAFAPTNPTFTVVLTTVTWPTTNGCNTITYTTSNTLTLSTINSGAAYTVTGLTGVTATYVNGTLSWVYATGCTTAVVYAPNIIYATNYMATTTPATTCCLPSTFAITSFAPTGLGFTVIYSSVTWPITNGCSTLSFTAGTTLTSTTYNGGNTYNITGLIGLTMTYSTGFLSAVYATSCTTAVVYAPNGLAAGNWASTITPASSCCLPTSFKIASGAFAPITSSYSIQLTSVAWGLISSCTTGFSSPANVTMISFNYGVQYTISGVTGLIITYASGNLSMIYTTGCTTPYNYSIVTKYSNIIGLGLTIFAFFLFYVF